MAWDKGMAVAMRTLRMRALVTRAPGIPRGVWRAEEAKACEWIFVFSWQILCD